MAFNMLKASATALTNPTASTDSDLINMDDLDELADYLDSIELEMKVAKKKRSTFHPFLYLPAELRNLVHEHIVHDTTINLDDVGKWETWPAICFASHQTYDEAVSIVYRCATFETNVSNVDFFRIINFIENLPAACLTALSANNNLTIFMDDVQGVHHVTAIELYALLQPWLSFCWSLAASGTDIRWFYKALVPAGPHWGITPSMANDLLANRGYPELKDVYALLQDERMKDEVAGMILALQSSSRYWRLLA